MCKPASAVSYLHYFSVNMSLNLPCRAVTSLQSSFQVVCSVDRRWCCANALSTSTTFIPPYPTPLLQFSTTIMDPLTPPESPMTNFIELYPPISSFPTFTLEELGLSPSPPRSPLPSDSNKDFENTQRDCALFPAYTDYLYGPDTRPKPSPSSSALLPQPHFAPPVSVYGRSWMHPEELAYQMLHQRKFLQAMASRTKNNFPQLPDLTTRPASASPAPAKQIASSFIPASFTQSIKRSQTTTQSLLYLSGRAPTVQIQRALHQGPNGVAIPTPQSTQTPQQGSKVLMPGQILTMSWQGISDLEKQNINTRVTMCWSALRTQDASHDNKQQSMAYLVYITNYVHTQHSNWMMRDGIRNLWRCVKMTRELPPQDPRHMEATEFVINFRQKLTPDAA
jgi:hypothetical protein